MRNQDVIEANVIENSGSESLESAQGFTFEDAVSTLTSVERFPVSSEKVAFWLGFSEKRKLQDRLKALFCVGHDFSESIGGNVWTNSSSPFSNILEAPQNGRPNVICWMTSECFERLLWSVIASQSPNPSVLRVKERAMAMLGIMRKAKNYLLAKNPEVSINNSGFATKSEQVKEISQVSRELRATCAKLIGEVADPNAVALVRLVIGLAEDMEQTTESAKSIAAQAVAKSQSLAGEVLELRERLAVVSALNSNVELSEQLKEAIRQLQAERQQQEAEFRLACEKLSADYQTKCSEADALSQKLRRTIEAVNSANQSAWKKVARSVEEFELALTERGREAGLRESDIATFRMSLPEISSLRLEVEKTEGRNENNDDVLANGVAIDDANPFSVADSVALDSVAMF